VKITEIFQQFAATLDEVRRGSRVEALDSSIEATGGRLVSTVGTLHLYTFEVSADRSDLPLEDVPVTILPPGGAEPTEGYILSAQAGRLLLQTFDAIGQAPGAATILPDAAGFLEMGAARLTDIAAKPDGYALGPAERLALWVAPGETGEAARVSVPASILTTVWRDTPADRRGSTVTAADQFTGMTARALKAASLPFKSLLCRYELSLAPETAGMALLDLGFEAQMHRFYAKSRAEKATLRRKYERFRELTPVLSYKAEKQRDLDEVKHLEWRLLTEISDLQAKIKEIDATVAEYESLPILKRLTLQAVGKNVESFGEYRNIYAQRIEALMADLETAQGRIEELKPEAAIPKDMRPEYDELKEEITRLGGTKKIRELLAAEEGTNRQAFIQNKRIVVTTAARIMSDPLFRRARFDVLIADEAPWIPAPYLLAGAALVREKIILSGDTRDLPTPEIWASPWRSKSALEPSATGS
jgi:hypothetical protein